MFDTPGIEERSFFGKSQVLSPKYERWATGPEDYVINIVCFHNFFFSTLVEYFCCFFYPDLQTHVTIFKSFLECLNRDLTKPS